MLSNNEVADVLEKAADHIHVHGHHKGYYAKGAKTCAKGAIYHAAGIPLSQLQLGSDGVVLLKNIPEISIEANKALSKYIPNEHQGHLPIWNDKPERTQEEVEDALKNCAKELRNSCEQ